MMDMPQRPLSVMTSQWDSDPYEVEPEETLRYLNSFFDNVNSTVYCMFPRDHFMRWVRRCQKKSGSERMLLYAMIALGSVFITDGQQSPFAQGCADMAFHAVAEKHGRFSLPLVQSRLLLSLYSFASGREGSAWDYCGSAFRAIGALHLNTENGCSEVTQEYAPRAYFRMPTDQLVECARRTFWAAFLLDVRRKGCHASLDEANGK